MKTPHSLLSTLGIILVLAVTAAPLTASAHTTSIDHGISALMHIAPYDHPTAGDPTQIHFQFKDTAAAFNINHCDCRLRLEQDEEAIATARLKPALADAEYTSETTVVFPKTGSYNLDLLGHAQDGSFPDFALGYTVTVRTGGAAAGRVGDRAAPYATAGGVILVGSVFGLLQYRRIRKDDVVAHSA